MEATVAPPEPAVSIREQSRCFNVGYFSQVKSIPKHVVPDFFVNCLPSQIVILNSCLCCLRKVTLPMALQEMFFFSTLKHCCQVQARFFLLFCPCFQGLGKVYLSVQPLLPGPMQGFFSIPPLLSCPEPEFLNFKEPRNRFQGNNSTRLHRLGESTTGLLIILKIRV
jgi:hypothetical protein